MIRETLPGGDTRLSGESGTFLFSRMRAGVLLTAFRGRDTGEFGTAPLDMVAQEHRFFGKPVEWFFDGSETENASRAVSEEWTAWLRKHRQVLSRLHVLTGNEETRLRISVARHFSDSMQQLVLYSQREKWQAIMKRSVEGLTEIPALTNRFDEPAVAVVATQSRDEGLILTAPGCRWTFRSFGKDVVYSAFAGNDSGELTDAALNEMQRLSEASPSKLRWFLDLRDAKNVATAVSRTWTEWLAAHVDGLARVTALATAPLFPLVLTVAKHRSGTDKLVRIHREVEPFRTELIAATSPAVAQSVGV